MQTGRPDVAALRQAIDERLRGRAAFSEVSYGDQPIVFSGRQLKSYVPQQLADARALARSPEMVRHSEAYIFWQQARLLADYEDDYDFRGHFSRYFPTYEVMSNDQLRGYFAWRTKWRAGEAPATETSFVYVLAYELLMGIGVADPQAGYEQLARLCEDYGDQDAHIPQNIGRWMDDYVVYWDLPADLLGSLAHRDADEALDVLLHRRDHSDDELFAAMTALSSYHLERSVFYKAHPDDVQQIAVRVYRSMADHHDRDLKRSLVETYFGVSLEQDYVLFPNAVFVDQLRYEDYSYEVSPLDHFRCHGARWSRDRYAGNLRLNRKLGALLKTIDATMRELYGFKPTLQAPLKTKYVLKLITTETNALLETRAEAERRAVHIDVSKLNGIRAAADKTRDSLLVDEDEVEVLVGAPEMRQPQVDGYPCDHVPRTTRQPEARQPETPLNHAPLPPQPYHGDGYPPAQSDGVLQSYAPLTTRPPESAAAELGLRPQTVLAPAAPVGRVSSAKNSGVPRPAAPATNGADLTLDENEGASPSPLETSSIDNANTKQQARGNRASQGELLSWSAAQSLRERGLSEAVGRVPQLQTLGGGPSAKPRLETPGPPAPVEDSPMLTPDECACLRIVLDGGSLRDFEREHHVMASLLIDSINEKLFDEFGDVVIDAGAEPPVAYDDYVDDLRGLIDG